MSTSQLKAAISLTAGLILFIVFFVQGIFFISANSPTYDEAAHVAAGYSYLAKRDFRLNPEHPPLIKQLLALPLFVGYRIAFNPDPQHWSDGDDYLIGQDLLYKSILPADRILLLSRLPNLLIGGILVALTGLWAYRIWGGGAGILAMALASLEPNLVAHSSLVTTDTGTTLFIFLSVYFLWEYLNFPKWWLLAATGISTGMALLSKFSALLLPPMIALIVAASFLVGSEPYLLPLRKKQDRPTYKLLLMQSVAVLFPIAFFALLTIPSAYFFQGFSPWLHGLEKFLTHAQDGHPAFFLGEYSYQGWWNYFLVAFLIKTPIGSLLLIAASFIFYRAGNPLRRREVILLLLPVLVVFLATTQAKVNIGLRHILPVYPCLFVIASRLATIHFRGRWLMPILVGIPLVSTAISSLRIAPHQLAYFNEFVGGPDQGYRYLSDSNIDWGQDLRGVKAYMEKENLPIIYLSYFGTAPPSYYGIRYQYVPGGWPWESPPVDKVPAGASRKILAISVCNLQDISTPGDPLFRWLWIRQPVAKIGYSIFVYDLTHDREGLTKLEETYGKAGVRPPP
jgi:4-amino-4-deoxy-L-arabinose transferase-like glycosyltransferase